MPTPYKKNYDVSQYEDKFVTSDNICKKVLEFFDSKENNEALKQVTNTSNILGQSAVAWEMTSHACAVYGDSIIVDGGAASDGRGQDTIHRYLIEFIVPI